MEAAASVLRKAGRLSGPWAEQPGPPWQARSRAKGPRSQEVSPHRACCSPGSSPPPGLSVHPLPALGCQLPARQVLQNLGIQNTWPECPRTPENQNWQVFKGPGSCRPGTHSSARRRPGGWMAGEGALEAACSLPWVGTAPRASGVSSTQAGTAWLAALAGLDAEPLRAQLESCSHLGCRRQSTHSLARKQPRCRQCRLRARGLLHLQAEASGRQGRAGTPSWC